MSIFSNWFHPFLDTFLDNTNHNPSANEWKAFCDHHNIEIVSVFLQFDNQSLYQEYLRQHNQTVDWKPTPPSNDHEMIALYDTEDGPVSLWKK